MTVYGHFDGKVIVPDEPPDALPIDLADQHDYYLYGHPKKDTRGYGPPTSLIPPSG